MAGKYLMLIHGIIVHKIEKDTRVADQPNPKAQITSRNKELDNTSPIVIELVEYIYNAYKTGKTFGSFDPDKANHPVQKWLADYIDDPDKSPFIPLTNSIMDRLKIHIDKENFATGGHLLFIDFTNNDRHWFMVVMIKDKKGFLFTEDLNLQDVKELELDKLHQAVRVDIDKWHENHEKSYLTFIKSGAGDVANYFLNTIGCSDTVPSKEVTKSVLRAIETVCEKAQLNFHQTRAVKDKACNYMEENPFGVSLPGICNIVDTCLPEDFWGDFLAVANSEDYQVSETFEPNKQVLSSHRRIKYDADHWKLAIDKDAIGRPGSNLDVIFDSEENSLTITNIPEELVTELIETLPDEE